MAKLWQFSQGHPKPAFSEKVQSGDQGKFFKYRQKSSPCFKGLIALWSKRHYPPISMHLKCKDWRWFWHYQRLEKYPNGQVMAIFARSPKPAFSKKLQMGDQGKFLKNRLKSSVRLKGPKALCRKWHYPRTSMLLRCKDRRRFYRRRGLQTCPNGKVMAIFAKSPNTRIFWKSTKGGRREIFQRSPKKQPSLKRANSTLAEMALSSN